MAVRAAVVVGRDELVADVGERLAGVDRALVLVGEPGIGKTTVWTEALAQIRSEWAWSTRCLEAERELGLAVLADLYAAVPDGVLSALPAAQRRVVDIVLFREDAPADVAVGDRLLGATTASVLRELSRSGGVLIGIDDLQWCDAASFRAFDFAVHRLADAPLRVLATMRTGSAVVFADAARVSVPGLGDGFLREVVQMQTGPGVEGAAIERAVALSAGNPFFARELGRQLNADPAATRLPPTLRTALDDRLATLNCHGRAALLDIAVLGAPSVDVIDADLRELVDAEIVLVRDGVVRFSHPLFVNAVLESTPPSQIREAHARASRILTDPVAAALHLAEAGTTGEEAAVRLDAAADIATGRGDRESSRRLAEHALTVTTIRPRPRQRLDRAANLEFAVGNLERVEQLGREMLADAVEPVDVATAMSRIGASLDDNDNAISMLLDAAEIDGLPDELHRNIATLATHVMYHSGRAAEAVVLLDGLLQTTDPADSPALVAQSVTLRRFLGLNYDTESLRRAVATERRWAADTDWSSGHEFGAIGAAGVLAVLDDRHDEAHRLLAEASDITARHGQGDDTAYFAALLSFRRGRLRDAAQQLREAMADDGPNAAPMARLAMIHIWLGEHQAAKDYIDAAHTMWHADKDPTIMETDFAAGLLLQVSGQADAAAAQLLRAAAFRSAIGLQEPSHPPLLPAAIEASAAIGDMAVAEEICDRLERESHAVQSRFGFAAARRSRGFIALARGNDDHAADCFADSIARFAAIDMPLERARAELALGSLLRRRGQRRKARDMLDAARVTFADCGAVDCQSTATAELAAISGRPPRRADDLTASEHRIVDLVATGMSNREVAHTLHLSVKTVEAHLNRAFRKLGVSNRTEMASRLATHDPRP